MIDLTSERWGDGEAWPFSDYTLDQVLEIYMHVNGLLGENKDRVKGSWFEDVAALARVILSERAQAYSVERFNTK